MKTRLTLIFLMSFFSALIHAQDTIPEAEELLKKHTLIRIEDVVLNDSIEAEITDTWKKEGEKDEESQPAIFILVQQMPEYPGGNKALLKYIADNIRYPREVWSHNVEGRVTVRAVIEPTGYVGNVEVIKGLHPECDKEAIRVIKSMPRWIPGRQASFPARVYYTIPVDFTLR